MSSAADSEARAADSNAVDNTSKAADDASSISAAAAAVEKTTRGSSLALGLSTGHFDVANVKMLRTCSEPDLSCLSRPVVTTATRKSVGSRREGRLSESHSHDSVHDEFSADVVSRTFYHVL